jgi:hypothetical protein
MLANRGLRIALAGASGLLLLGGIAGAVTVDEEPDQDGPSEALAPNETTPDPLPGLDTVAPVPFPGASGAETTATTAAAGATTTAAAGQAATTTTAAARGGAAAKPGALVAPKPGDYAYDATTTSPSGSRTDRTTTKVEAAGTEGATTIQAITIPLDLGGQQALTRNTVAWGSAGAVVRRSLVTITAFGQPQQIDCAWQPAFPQYAGALAVGRAWSFTTRCAAQVQGVAVTIEQRASRKVTGAAAVVGPAGSVATWTIADDTTVVVTTPFGPASVRTVGTQQLAPSLGLPVSSTSEVEARMGASAPEKSTVTTKLVGLP